MISFGASQGKPFIVSMTPIWQKQPNRPGPNQETLRKDVEAMMGSIRPFAVEKNIKIVKFEGASGPGFYFSATDNAPTRDGFKYMTKGELAVGELTLTFTILTNDGQADVVRDSLTMFRSAIHQ